MMRRLYTLLCISLWALLPLISIAQPVANFSSNVTNACSPIVAQFTDLSTGTPTSWSWDLGNGVTSSSQNPSTTYITPGTYTVILTASNAGGSNTKTVTNYITVKASPFVNFTGDSSISCAPKTIAFNNLTIPNAGGSVTYLWDFGDGGSSNGVAPSHTYTTTGNFNVTLVVTNSLGCNGILSKPGYIPIPAKSVPSFTSANNNNCVVPSTVNFQNTSSNAVSYDWSFGDGGTSTQASPSHQYNSPGSYNVRLITKNSNGCPDTIIQTAFVNLGALNAAFTTSANTVCVNNTVNFTNTTTPAAGSVSWDFGNGNTATTVNASTTYATPGTYNIRMISQVGTCKDTAYQTVVVVAKPVSAFYATNVIACTVPFTTNFINASSGANSYMWFFGDGTTSTQTNPSKTYTTTGLFTVRLVSYNSGCNDTLTINNYVNTQGLDSNLFHINFPASSNRCAPANVQFFTYTTSPVPTPQGYAWDFGNGQTIASCPTCGPFINGNFPTPGTYTVKATWDYGNGCLINARTNITIGSKPLISFSALPTTICPNQMVTFTNTTTNATSYTWMFGDGGTSILTNPTHVYQVTGNYPVTLVGTNNFCSDTLIVPNKITVQPPTANFGSTYSCANRKQFTFSDSAIGADTYYWNFGDGNTSTSSGPLVTHTYVNFGTYIVTQAVTNTATGCTDTFRKTITAYPFAAAFSASKTTLCKNEPVTFTPVYDSNYVAFEWYYGNGLTNGSTTAGYQYPNVGVYSVKLVVTDRQGCKDSLTKINYITVSGPLPDFSATPLGGCSPLNVSFTDNSTSSGSAITSRQWRWGDGQQTNTTNTSVSHTYTTNGSFSVALALTDANGCVDSLVKTAYINTSKPTAAFTSGDTTVCKGLGLSFVNLSVGTGLSYLWDFGDGNTATTFAATHGYTNVGSYNVKLVVTDNNGCKDSVVKANYVDVFALDVKFSTSDTVEPCPPLAVNFTNTSTGINTVLWTLGNGGNSNLNNPSSVYTYPGVYQVKLIGSTTAGCKDSATQNITVYGPTGSFSYGPITGCNPLTVNFTSTNNNTSSLVWDMNNGYTQTTTASSFTYTYTQSGKYLPKLILSDNASCLVPITGVDTIKVDDVIADFTFAPSGLCGSGTIQFTDTVFTSISTPTRHWDFGDLGTSTAHNPSHFYAAPGTYQVRLIIDNVTGCDDTVFKTVTVHTLPTVTGGANQSICAGASIILNATGAVSYVWSPATGLSCTNCTSPTASPTGTITYTVIGTDANGCTDDGTIIITVNLRPNVSAGNNVSTCAGTPVTLTATGAISYVWSPATGLSNPSIANPTANPAATTTYTVTGTDINGCTDTGVVIVTVNALPNVSAGPNVAICNGNSTILTATGASTYVWSPATGLSCTNCASPTANPTVTTTYTVTGTDGNGCVNTSTVTVTVTALPNVSGGPNKSICIGSSTTLNATGAATYSWSPATGLSCTNCANPVANPTVTTTYTVIGTSGCTGSATVTVTVNPLPNVSAGTNKIICAGSSATLQATGATTYSWSPITGLSNPNIANPSANPTVTTTYTVTGTDANGCVNTSSVTVTVNPLPNVSGGANKIICSGSSTTLNATGATTYVWSPVTGLSNPNIANPIANPTATTTYTVTGTDGNGCINTATVTVTVNPLPNVSVSPNVSICIGASTTLQATGATTYSWSPITGLSNPNIANPIANPTVTTPYTVTGTNGNGCINTATVTVTVNPLPNVSAGSNVSICTGSSTTLQATGATTYSWSPSTGLSNPSIANPVASPTTTTTYTVTGTNANGCIKTASVTVTVNPLPNVNAGNDKTICANGSVSLLATGALIYTWSPPTGLSSTTVPNPNANPLTTTIYTVSGTDINGCINTDQVTVNVNPVPNVSGGGNQSICIGSSIQLNASGALSYVWSGGPGLSCYNCASPTANPTITTPYTVTGTDANGCIGTDNVTVTVNAIPVVTASTNKAVICDGTSAQLQANGATNYSWSPVLGLSNTTIANPVAAPNVTITYIVTGTTNGCSDTAHVNIAVLPKPNVNAGNDTAICIGGEVTLHASGTINYTWSPATGLSCTNCPDPLANPIATTTYALTGSDANGCTNTDAVVVTVHPSPNIYAGDDVDVCNGAAVQLVASGGTKYQWSPPGGLSCVDCKDPFAKPGSNVLYTVVGIDQFGCTDSDKVQVNVRQKLAVTASKGGEICRGDSIELFATGGDNYQWTPPTGLNNETVANPIARPSGTIDYKVIIKQGKCFADTLLVPVIVNEIPEVDAGPDQTISNGNIVKLNAVGTLIKKYAWTPADSLSCSDCATPIATPLRTTRYIVTVHSDAGCINMDSVTVFVSCGENELFIANTFTPNGDGINDYFYPQGTGITHAQSFRVYNRWGQLMYEGRDIPLNDPKYGWDGKFKNEPLNPDVFVYILNATCESGKPIELKGDISLIR